MNSSKILFSLIFLFFWSANTFIGLAQGCFSDGIKLGTQQAIDNFANQYPGCLEIEGVLTIGLGFSNDITNLDGLNHLTSAGGLKIDRCYELVDLKGLASLEVIYGPLTIEANSILTSLEGLESLHYIGGTILIARNFNLETLAGFFEKINTINGNLTITRNTELEDLSGLSSLKKIKGNFKILDNFSLKTLEGLSSLKSVSGEFLISENRKLTTLQGLENLQSIDNSFSITYNFSLENLKGLSALSSINGDLIIRFTDLYHLDDLASLKYLTTDLIIDQNSNLFRIGLFDELEFIGGHVVISNNRKLIDLSGFGCSSFFGTESITIDRNEILESLEGLEHTNLSNLSALIITNNDRLKSCAYENICEFISDGKSITAEDNGSDCNRPSIISDACQDLPMNELNCEGSPFPNPTNDFLMLTCECNHDFIIKYRIFHNSGMEISTGIFDHKAIDISKLNSGTYFIRFEDGNEIDLSFTFVKT